MNVIVNQETVNEELGKLLKSKNTSISSRLSIISGTYSPKFNTLLGENFGTLDTDIIMSKEFDSEVYSKYNDVYENRSIGGRKYYLTMGSMILSLEANGYAYHSSFWNRNNSKSKIRFINRTSKTIVVLSVDHSNYDDYGLATPENVKFYNKLETLVNEEDARLEAIGKTTDNVEESIAKFEVMLDKFQEQYFERLLIVTEVTVYSATLLAHDVTEWLTTINDYARRAYSRINLDRVSKTTQNYIGYNTVESCYCIRTRQINVPELDDDLFNKNYDINMALYSRDLVNYIKTENNGLILLHGTPGTGKTQFTSRLSYMLHKENIDTLFIPASLVSNFKDLEFTQYLEDYLQGRNCLVVIEDAEVILQKRENNLETSGITSHLLNIIDGSLGGQKSFVLATFNTGLENIDPAMLRAGRLIDRVELGALSTERANDLAKYIGSNSVYENPTTVAEVWESLKNQEHDIEIRKFQLEEGNKSGRYKFANSLTKGSEQ